MLSLKELYGQRKNIFEWFATNKSVFIDIYFIPPNNFKSINPLLESFMFGK